MCFLRPLLLKCHSTFGAKKNALELGQREGPSGMCKVVDYPLPSSDLLALKSCSLAIFVLHLPEFLCSSACSAGTGGTPACCKDGGGRKSESKK